MGRGIRYIFKDGCLVLLICEVNRHRQLVLTPEPERPGILSSQETLAGVLGHYLVEKSDAEIVAFDVRPGEVQILIFIPATDKMKKAMCEFKANVTKRLNEVWSTKGSVWGQRYRDVVISDEPEDQIEQLRCMLHRMVHTGTPLARTSIESLLAGKPLQARYVDKKGSTPRLVDRPVRWCPLPCWRYLGADEVRAKIEELLPEDWKDLLGIPRAVESVLPGERFYAKDPEVRAWMETQYRDVVQRFRAAAKQLRNGVPNPSFPAGTFPPALPYVPYVRGSPA